MCSLIPPRPSQLPALADLCEAAGADWQGPEGLVADESLTKRRVLILHTGGTIGMVPTAEGYAPKPGVMARALAKLCQEHPLQLPQIDLIESDPLLDSTDLSTADWVSLASQLVEALPRYDGVVILHGTDTMAYTASALSFMLQGLAKPVILTGAQIPLCRLRSDGRENLLTAVCLAATSQIPEVCLYFGGRLLRGNRSTKISADQLRAFDSPNYPVLAESGIDLTLYRARCLPAPAHSTLQLLPFQPQRIGILKVFPGIQFSLFENLPEQGLNGLILEAFGAGNIPLGEGGFRHLLESCASRNIPTVVLTQCLQGRARLGEYATSAGLTRLGAINGGDLTVEAAVTKLTHLLSQGLTGRALHEAMVTPLCGELTPLEQANP